jgi:plastocyanin
MRRITFYFILGLGLAATIGTVYSQAAIEGRVQLPKPAADRGLNQRYQPSAEIAIGPVDPPTAVVYLEGNFPTVQAANSKPDLHMAQKNINFLPNLMAVQVGTTVDFPNLDDTYHNVFSYSKAKRFDLGRYRKDETPGTVLFDKPGVISVHCEIHERMRGTILVLETPHFKKTDTEGRYRLEHLPVGHFLLKAWVSESDVREQPVELKANATLRVDFPAK